jgi:hypothetical protein
MLLALLPPVALVLALFSYSPDINPCPFGGRLSTSLSYSVAVVSAFGGQQEYEYVLFANPQSLPIVRKQISTGTIVQCSHPALNVSFGINSVRRTVQIKCKEFDGTRAAEIPLDQLEKDQNVEVSE